MKLGNCGGSCQVKLWGSKEEGTADRVEPVRKDCLWPWAGVGAVLLKAVGDRTGCEECSCKTAARSTVDRVVTVR